MQEPTIVKRYANRRLYDTRRSTYITLADLAVLIRSGQRVQVVDAQSQEDVTAFTLTQILVEQARERQVLLPVPLLHLFIQYGDSVLQEFFERHLALTIQSYLGYRKALDEQFRQWLEMGADWSTVARQSVWSTPSMEKLLELFGGGRTSPPKDSKEPT
jgi:polyhydroxyalkanoate synthesis repressor PhaR